MGNTGRNASGLWITQLEAAAAGAAEVVLLDEDEDEDDESDELELDSLLAGAAAVLELFESRLSVR